MNKETRIKKIEALVERGKKDERPLGAEIPWEGSLQWMQVHKIPLEYLVYNKYNGRILSRTKSLERQSHQIDVEAEEGKKTIEKLLWNSKISANKRTLEDIERHEQQKHGIITRDGIIIDGNRRAMLLNNLYEKHPVDKFKYFKAVVLPVTLEESPLDIQRLETVFQMGEDEKLGYNATEKYLKADSLRKQGVSSKEIAEWMGEEESKVKEYLEVMDTMDEYLQYLDYDGVYTQLDGREDPFIHLTKWLKGFYGENSVKAFDGYKNSDVDDLKYIAFEYIRAKYEGKSFRILANGLKENHFFGDREIWADFHNFHEERMKIVRNQEESIDLDSENLQAHLNARDDQYFELTKDDQGNSFLDENIALREEQLGNKRSKNKPSELVEKAKRALEAIDQKHKAFSTSNVMDQVEELSKITNGMLKNKSPGRLLSEIVQLLESVEVEKDAANKEELLNSVAEINRISFEMKKQLGG